MTFLEKLEQTITKNNSLLSIGLDPDVSKIPQHMLQKPDSIFEFNKAIIDSTHDLVASYKPNSAFYEAEGTDGISQLKKTIDYIQTTYSDIPVILDAKRADIGNTSEMYAKFAFEFCDADAITVNPYMGLDSISPFFERQNKGIFVLVKTSNPGSTDFQDIDVQGQPLYIRVAEKIVEWNKTYKNLCMVTGATWPEEIRELRKLAPDMFFLVPGIGTQEGDLQQTLTNGLRVDKSGLLIHSGRSILYASNGLDFAEKARFEAQKLKDQINLQRNGN